MVPTIEQQLKKIEKQLQPQINRALKTQVAEVVVAEISRSVKDNVYDEYEPLRYNRTGKLASPDYIPSELVNNGLLRVYSDRPPEYDGINKYDTVGEVITYGEGYTWGQDLGRRIGPRPFMEPAAEALRRNREHVKAMQKGLREQGLDVR